jgi:tight adherence protein B
MHNLGRQITQTWPTLSLARFAFLSIGIAIAGGFLVWGLSGATLLGSVAAGAAAFLPMIYLKTKVAKHEKRLLEQLPEGLDFLSRVLKAGHSLSTGLQMMGEEMAEPLASVFRQCYDQHSLGQSLEEALKDAALSVDNSDFGFFVTAILIQRQTGGDLSEVLGNISGMIRQRIRLQSSVKAKTAEGRFTGYILVVFPIIMFFLVYVLSPAYANVLLHTRTGIYLLCTAALMLIMGQIVIRKVTTIKV